MFRFWSELGSVFSNFDLILMKLGWSRKVPREVLLLLWRRRLLGRWRAGVGATDAYYVALAEVGL